MRNEASSSAHDHAVAVGRFFEPTATRTGGYDGPANDRVIRRGTRVDGGATFRQKRAMTYFAMTSIRLDLPLSPLRVANGRVAVNLAWVNTDKLPEIADLRGNVHFDDRAAERSNLEMDRVIAGDRTGSQRTRREAERRARQLEATRYVKGKSG